MNAVFDIISTYPTVIYSALLGVALFYWILTIVSGHQGHHGGGLHGGHGGGHGLHLHHHHHGELKVLHGHHGTPNHHGKPGEHNLGWIASAIVATGLNGVPFSIVFSFLVLFAWLFTGLTAEYLLPWIPTVVLRTLVGTGTLIAAFILAVPITAVMVRPLRVLFVTHHARSNYSLVGQPCTILTLKVTTEFGQAEVAVRGACIQVQVRADEPNDFTKGSRALILDYDENSHRYLVGSDALG